MKLVEINPSSVVDGTEIPGEFVKAYSLVDGTVDPVWFMNSSYDLLSAMIVLVDSIDDVNKIVESFKDHFEEDIIKPLVDDGVTADHSEGVSALVIHKCLDKYTATFVYIYAEDYAIETLNRSGVDYSTATYLIAGGEANDLSPVEALTEELWDSYEDPAVKLTGANLDPSAAKFEKLWKKWLDDKVPTDERISHWTEETTVPWASEQFILEHGYFD